jgi:hypothetical protein
VFFYQFRASDYRLLEILSTESNVPSAVIRVAIVIESISTKLDRSSHYGRIVEGGMYWNLCIAGEFDLKNTGYGGNTRSLYHGVALQLKGSGGQTPEI